MDDLLHLYDLGAADDDDVGALVVTPSAIKDEMDTVDAFVRQLDVDIQASNVRQPFKDAFNAFRDEWRRFNAEHETWWGRLWGAVYEKATDYRRRAEEWRKAFLAEGGYTAVPSVAPPPSKAGGSSAYLWLAGAGLAALGLSSVASMRR
jgi:hypothetical protein